jgi:DNA-binding response OmpR family regulator
MQNILLAGQDLRLLSTRAAVLKKTGATVMCCKGSDALRFVESETLDLVVLCHSVDEEEAEFIAEKVRRNPHRPRVLLMISDLNQEKLYRVEKFDGTSLTDPEDLIAHATELLQESLNDSTTSASMNAKAHVRFENGLGSKASHLKSIPNASRQTVSSVTTRDAAKT